MLALLSTSEAAFSDGTSSRAAGYLETMLALLTTLAAAFDDRGVGSRCLRCSLSQQQHSGG